MEDTASNTNVLLQVRAVCTAIAAWVTCGHAVAELLLARSYTPKHLGSEKACCCLHTVHATYYCPTTTPFPGPIPQVTRVLRQMLTTTSADATPQGEEAQRVLGFFINRYGRDGGSCFGAWAGASSKATYAPRTPFLSRLGL